MASDRFYFWRGYHEALKKLPSNERRGAFVLAMCAYAFDGIEPDFSSDPMLDFAWSLITDQLSQSVEIGRRSSRNGRKGGRPKGSKSKKSSAKSGVKSRAKSTVKSSAESDMNMNGHEMNGHEMNVRSSNDERGAEPTPRGAGRSAPVRPVSYSGSVSEQPERSSDQATRDPNGYLVNDPNNQPTNNQTTNNPITSNQKPNNQLTNNQTTSNQPTSEQTTKDLIEQAPSPDYLIDLDEEDWDESPDLLVQEPIEMQDLSSLTGVTDDGATDAQ